MSTVGDIEFNWEWMSLNVEVAIDFVGDGSCCVWSSIHVRKTKWGSQGDARKVMFLDKPFVDQGGTGS